MSSHQESLQPAMTDNASRHDLNQMAVNCWGTAAVLDKRVRTLLGRTKTVNYLGFITPFLVGAFALAFTIQATLLPQLMWLAAFALFVQAIASATLIFTGVDRSIRSCLDSSATNKIFAAEARDLATNTSLPAEVFNTTFAELRGKIKAQDTNDERLDFSEQDRKFGLRAGLKRFQIACGDCRQTPRSEDASLDQSNCKTCGV